MQDHGSMLQIHGTVRCVSDLHLRREREDIAARFERFLADTSRQRVSALLILGDLFEYWIGDDDLDEPFNARICASLRQISDLGTALYFIAGNRDFLIGPAFAKASGMHLLNDAAKVGAGDTALLLMHGDTLCTDDLPYQQFRAMVRDSKWQQDFLSRPLEERRAEVAKLRQRSADAMRGKTAEIMDANASAVRAAIVGSGCSTLIHGHTHRPGEEVITGPDGSFQRWVLSDWDTDRGDAIEITADGLKRIDLSN